MIKIVETPTKLKVHGPKEEIEELIKAFRFRPPDYWRSSAYQLYKISDGERGWDGWSRPLSMIQKRSRDPKLGDAAQAWMFRGHLSTLLEKADHRGIEVNRDDLLPRPFLSLLPDDLPDDLIKAKFELDEMQRSAITEWLRATIGNNKISVGGGKTAMFAAVASFIKRTYPSARFLYMTQSERLVKQAYQDISKFLPEWSISQYGGSKKDNTGKDMVISTSAMLWRNRVELVKLGWFKTFMGFLVDESHHLASPSQSKIAPLIPAFFRLGASDSLKSDDIVRRTMIEGLIGPVLNEVSSSELITTGRLARPTIYVVDVPTWKNKFAGVKHIAEEGSPAWAYLDGTWKKATYLGKVHEHDPNASDGIKRDAKNEPVVVMNSHLLSLSENPSSTLEVSSRLCLLHRMYDTAIIRFKERNDLIARWASYFSRHNKPTLVVCTRTLHILMLETLIGEKVGAENVAVLYSHHDTRERDRVFEWLKQTPGGVMITPLAKEGVSINEIRAVIVADYVADHEVCRQFIGRGVRVKETDNEAEIVLFLERQHPTYKASSIKLINKLQDEEAFKFVTPVQGPEFLENEQSQPDTIDPQLSLPTF